MHYKLLIIFLYWTDLSTNKGNSLRLILTNMIIEKYDIWVVFRSRVFRKVWDLVFRTS